MRLPTCCLMCPNALAASASKCSDLLATHAGVWEERQQFYGASGAQSSILPALDAALGVQHPDGWLKAYLATMRLHMPRHHRAFIADVEVCTRHSSQVLNDSCRHAAGLVGNCHSSDADTDVGTLAVYLQPVNKQDDNMKCTCASEQRTAPLSEFLTLLAHMQSQMPLREFVQHHAALRTIYDECIERLTRFRSQHRGFARSYIQQQSSKGGEVKGTGGTTFMPALQSLRNATAQHAFKAGALVTAA